MADLPPFTLAAARALLHRAGWQEDDFPGIATYWWHQDAEDSVMVRLHPDHWQVNAGSTMLVAYRWEAADSEHIFLCGLAFLTRRGLTHLLAPED